MTKYSSLLVAVVLSVGMQQACFAIDEFEGIKTIDSLPQTLRELEVAHRRSRGDACESLPKGEPLELTNFTTYITNRDRRERLAFPTIRQSVLAIGLEFEARDEADLPTLSSGKITGYVEENCMVVQARVRRDLLDRKLYFHHRPLALTRKYRGSRLTQGFEPIVATRTREFHSLGLFVRSPGRLSPEKMRTLVLLFKNEILRPRERRIREQFEFVLVRGREQGSRNSLDCHVFVSTDDRRELHYLRQFDQPKRASECGILGRIVIRDYDSTGLYPKSSATRSFRIDAKQTFSMIQLDQFCREERLDGGFSRNVDTVLDAVIDGLIAPEKARP